MIGQHDAQTPTSNNPDEWRVYWRKLGQTWRTEPEIDIQRQEYLDEQCGIAADINKGTYSFKGVQLSRADLEWLLASYLDERGNIDWSDTYGLDLRGVILHKVDLRGLPLRGMRCGLSSDEWTYLNNEARETLTEEEKALFTEEDRIYDEALPTVVRQRIFTLLKEAGANLEEADLRGIDLEMAHFAGTTMKRAWFDGANLAKADLSSADLQWTHFAQANLQEADLSGANLEQAYLRRANLRNASFYGASMKKGVLEGANLTAASLVNTHLEEGRFSYALLEQADFSGACLERANLREINARKAEFTGACLRQVYLDEADLTGANLAEVHMEGASLHNVHLEQANLSKAYLGGGYALVNESCSKDKPGKQRKDLASSVLQPADLSGVFFDGTTILTEVRLGDKQCGFASLADIHWNDVNLAVVDWTEVKMLGDERQAHQQRGKHNELESNFFLDADRDLQLDAYRKAVRANRQLAVVLQSQGLNEEASRFAYRAHLLQRAVLRRQKKFVQYFFSMFLDLLAGYGYRPGRSIVAYLTIIFGFMALYLLNAHFVAPHLLWDEALVLSVSSFHGRGFFTQDIMLGDTYARLAALEAVVGLLIEVSFIATFTQRFFGK